MSDFSRGFPRAERLEGRLLLSGSIAEFHLPVYPPHPNEYDPSRIAAGPDGNLWFGGAGPPFTIDRITPAGAMTEFTLPQIQPGIDANSYGGIAAGHDGNVWFGNSQAVGKVTPGGGVAWFPLPRFPATDGVEGMSPAPDGNVWFTEYFGNRIGRVTPSGGFTEFPIPTPGAQPTNITLGPDGNLWFTERATSKIGRITTASVITEFPSVSASPDGITSGPDGNVWFASLHAIGKVTPAGQVTLFPLTAGQAEGNYITAGPDGNLWFMPYNGSLPIGRMTTDGRLTLYPPLTPTSLTPKSGIVAGPDGNMWFVEGAAQQIGRIDLHSAALPGGFAGSAFDDRNYNGIRDAGEPGLYNMTVYLDSNGNGVLDAGEPKQITDTNGQYLFPTLVAGSYVVRHVPPTGYRRTAPQAASVTVSLTPGQAAVGPVFGDVRLSAVQLNFNYLLLIAQHYGQAGSLADGDLNTDDLVDFSDLLLLAQKYGHTAAAQSVTQMLPTLPKRRR